MFQTTQIMLGLYKPLLWVAQVPVNPSTITPAQASVVTSGPRFFVALIAGVILAFAIQLVLTNLSVAAGITYLGHQPDSDSSSNHDSVGGTIRKIGTAVGIWTLVTVTIALLIASFLAVKLSLLVLSPGLGAILGLVIWGAYFFAVGVGEFNDGRFLSWLSRKYSNIRLSGDYGDGYRRIRGKSDQ
jgi:hypothetical protein